MSILKIVVVTLLVTLTTIECSVVAPAIAPVPAIPAFRYTQVAPPSVLPFSAQVSTFTRNLHVFDAPYAAGVIPGPPPIVQRAILPAPVAPLHPAPFLPAPVAPLHPAPFLPAPVAPLHPAPFLPTPVAPAPFLPAPAPVIPAPLPKIAHVYPGVAPPAPALSYVGQAPGLPYHGHVPISPYAGAVPGWPFDGGLVAPVARSVHAVAPPFAPVVGPAPLLG